MTIRLGLLLLVSAFLASGASAQTAQPDVGWPSKPVRFIVPFPAGSSTDVVARIVGQMLAARLGQLFVIDNRAGASGNIGADLTARATPDGYTIGIATTSTHALAPNLTTALPYHPLNDFAPVVLIGSAPYVMVTYPGLETKTVREFIALAKAKPGTINYGSAGPASLAHLAGVLFANAASVKITHVPYKSSAQSTTDLITGRLDMQFSTMAPTLPFIRSGQLRALAVTGGKRSATMPEMPTVAEAAGLPGYEAALWMGIVAPAGTPPAVVERLNRAVTDILQTEEAKQSLLQQGLDTDAGTPAAFRTLIEGDIAKWRTVIADAGVHVQ
jgi:tripartite-type tricarboxylate transporter receptor subunit TctC